MKVSAATVRRHFLDPGMGARALNLGQASLLANDTPEPDSLLDHLAALRADNAIERQHLHLARHLAVHIHQLNDREGDHELAIAGAADQLARDLRAHELNGTRGRPGGPGSGASGILTAKQIARRVRGPLDVLSDPAGHDAGAIVDAARAVDDVIRQVPAAQLLAPQVRHELWHRRFELLRDLHARRTRGQGDSLAPLPPPPVPGGVGARDATSEGTVAGETSEAGR